MTVEMTLEEAKIVIAVMTYAEGNSLVNSEAIHLALRELRPWRTALLLAFLRAERPTTTPDLSEQVETP